MNVVQLQDMLRGLPDDRLKQELSKPTGTVPEYLVLSEVVRRDKLRESAASAPQSTVVQDVMGAMQPQQQPMAMASGGFISPSAAMGNAGVRGFAPEPPKQPSNFGFSTGGPQMFTPNTTPQPPAPVTNNTVNVPPPQIPAPQPQFDDGQQPTPNDPGFYEQPQAYANGGVIGLANGGDPRQAFIEMMMPHALRVSAETGVDPRIVISQAALETGWGKSAPGGNYFGIKSHGKEGGQNLKTKEVGPSGEYETTASFRQYGDVGESADDYANFLLKNPRYGDMLNAKGLDAQIEALGKSGYATDPKYATKIRSIASSPLLANVAPAGATQQPSQETAVASIMNPADRAAGILSGGVMPDPRKRGIGSFFADLMSNKDAKGDFMELGSTLFAKGQEQEQAPEAPGITRGDPSLAATIGGKSPDEILAEYRALRTGYMANGGAVRMREGGTPPSGEIVLTLNPLTGTYTDQNGKFYSRDEAKKILDKKEGEAPKFNPLTGTTVTPGGELKTGAPELSPPSFFPRIMDFITPKAPEEEKYGATNVTTRPDAAFRERGPLGPEGQKSKTPITGNVTLPEGPSPFDDYLKAYKESQDKIAQIYRDQAAQEIYREKEAGGLPFLLRQLGIGMIATGGPLQEGVRGGLQQAFAAREEQTQAARDRIRELNLKGEMTELEAANELAKLSYQAEIDRQKSLREGAISREKYFEEANKLETEIIKAIAEGAEPEELAEMRTKLELYLKLAGIPQGSGGLADVPAGTIVVRE